ncbi:FtsX-like permease family protein [Campylobacter sp. MIT 21-1685]|uniref:ABC transporter permease n=1 Tax=unclassified Campylobacter TaxID=2593542 RepID=UPI00224B3605|nr:MULTISPECIES: FtsX-like permease family protein [unclassified Campylobacter]MCX2682598.1 FtsX-like permease family protein [Campylobacter sp. MIT 21-1684]MCX2750878.1 FtsX-like permease family protein [Campylobacter sp. MIT 21-1682]MCX2807189.1 FtsX-like permease family protein [Campylobacter sp. MIT 21-1685]
MADKFFFTEVYKSISFSYQRLFIILLSVFIGALTCSAFLNIYFDIDTKLSKELKAYGANVMLNPKEEQNFISNDEFERLKQDLQAKAVSPFLFEFFNLGSTSAIVLGTDFKALKITKPFMELKSGSLSLNDLDDKSAILGVDLAKQLEKKVGDEVQIYNQNNGKSLKLTIKAIVSSSDEFDSLLLATLSVVQNLSDTQGINYANAVVYGDYESINAKAQTLTNDSTEVKPISSVSLSESFVLNKIKALMFLIILVILIIVTTSVNTTLSAIIFSRKKEIALRLALGATKSQIITLFASECFVVSLVASIMGALCGIVLANVFGIIIFNAHIDFRFKALFAACIISLIFALIAAVFPLRQALKINVCENLKGE